MWHQSTVTYESTTWCLSRQCCTRTREHQCHWWWASATSTPCWCPKQDPANVNIVNEYNSFNLANVTLPTASKWKMSETLLDDFHKFKWSCQRIFDGPMCHITSGKVRTSMLLIWAGLDGEDIYENFNLLPHQKYDVDYVLRRFQEFYEPICNFRMARFKFSKVYQYSGETIDVILQ